MQKSCLAALASALALTTANAAGSYQFIKEIPIGGTTGWDYLSVDTTARRLYVSHHADIVVIDLEKDAIVGEIAETPGVHGLAVAPELQRGFSSNGKENKVSIVDLATRKTIAKIGVGENPDAILFEPGHREVYVF